MGWEVFADGYQAARTPGPLWLGPPEASTHSNPLGNHRPQRIESDRSGDSFRSAVLVLLLREKSGLFSFRDLGAIRSSHNPPFGPITRIDETDGDNLPIRFNTANFDGLGRIFVLV